MNRTIFLTIFSIVALSIGSLALFFPAILLESKGITFNSAADLWMRETGLLILSSGILSFLIRAHADSPTLRAVLFGNIIIQLGLFTLEFIAYRIGIITKLSGVIVNLPLHILLASFFIYFFKKMKR